MPDDVKDQVDTFYFESDRMIPPDDQPVVPGATIITFPPKLLLPDTYPLDPDAD